MIRKRRSFHFGLSLTAAALLGSAASLAAQEAAPVPRSPGLPYAPKNLPDRIVLTPGADPARDMAVAFRTDTGQAAAEAQIAVSVDGPTLEEKARLVAGTTTPVDSSYGPALYHQVHFTGLAPDTVYTYRVKGAAVRN